MNQIRCIDTDEIIGKTIKNFLMGRNDDCMVLQFEDGSIIQFYCSVGDDEGWIECNSFFKPMDFSTETLERFFGDTFSEHIATRKKNELEANEKQRIESEKRERVEYERLKAKFEPVMQAQPTNMELAS